MILSSESAKKDLFSLCQPDPTTLLRVIPFVSQPVVPFESSEKVKELLERLDLRSPYVFLPNQFWRHKNHALAFKAMNKVVRSNPSAFLVCSGRLFDHRDKTNRTIEDLLKYLDENNLGSNIRILGDIPYEEVALLIQGSRAVLNPSLFEGWSSSVEEAKTFGKTVLLSDIEVHREQSPRDARFFQPDDVNKLAQLIEEVFERDNRKKPINAKELRKGLEQRTKDFGSKYIELLDHLCREIKEA